MTNPESTLVKVTRCYLFLLEFKVRYDMNVVIWTPTDFVPAGNMAHRV